jgi:hypothetical protein
MEGGQVFDMWRGHERGGGGEVGIVVGGGELEDIVGHGYEKDGQ